MKTTVFDWWKKKGKTIGQLAETLNYSSDYLYHLVSGDYPITEGFKARCVLHLGEDARFLFFGDGDTPKGAIRYEPGVTQSPQAPADAP
jgi:hypothetical protein